jgi:hypothetical protein
VKVCFFYYLQGFQNLVGNFYLILTRSKKDLAGNEKVIIKTKTSIIDPIGTVSPDFSSGI